MFGKRSGQHRTPEDRARAAAERAARRAGRPLPPEAFEDTIRPPDVEPHEPIAQRTVEYTPTFHTDEQDSVAGEDRPGQSPRDDAVAAEPPLDEAPPADPPAPPPRDDADPPAPPPRDEAPPADPPAPPRDVAPAAAEPPPPSPPIVAAPDDAPPPPPPEGPLDLEEGGEIVAHAREPRLVAARERSAARVAGSQETAEHVLEWEQPEANGSHEEPPPLPPPLPPRRPAPATPRRRRPAPAPPRTPGGGGSRWGRRIGLLVALVIVAAGVYIVNSTFQPFHGDGGGNVEVVIPQGATAGQIGDLLAAKGVVDSGMFFEADATLTGNRGKLRPGRYTLARGMKNSAVIDELTAPPPAPKPVKTVSVRFTEGPALREMAPLVARSHKVRGSYLAAARSQATLRRIRRLGAPSGTKTPEGFLFPATYTLKRGSTARALVDKQLDAFRENFGKVDLKYAKRKNLTRYDVLTIASMIEREVQVPRERPLVAAVIYNRLKRGMPLQIDASIRYYTGNWQRPIRQSELDADEPYNTTLNRGLPPTPIGNPGLASLRAAAHPAHQPYLFYVRKPGKSGEHAFSSTDAQFGRDLQRYQQSREGK